MEKNNFLPYTFIYLYYVILQYIIVSKYEQNTNLPAYRRQAKYETVRSS